MRVRGIRIETNSTQFPVLSPGNLSRTSILGRGAERRFGVIWRGI
jgi:hypothetical protein